MAIRDNRSTLNEAGLKQFRDRVSEIDKLFAEIVTRREDANISREVAYRDLKSIFNLDAIILGSNSEYNVIRPLEKPEELERILARPSITGNSSNHCSQVKRYGQRMSHYLNYLGFNDEINRFFDVFSKLDDSLVYTPNTTPPSPKILFFKSGIQVHKTGFRGRNFKIKPNNKVY